MNLLTRLRELSEKATKGPWKIMDVVGKKLTIHKMTDQDACAIARIENQASKRELAAEDSYNAELIALMRNNIDKLLDVVVIAKKYDSDMCFCDDELINTGGGMCTQCALHQAFEALERET